MSSSLTEGSFAHDLENADDSASLEKSLIAIQDAVLIAVRYNLSDIFDFY